MISSNKLTIKNKHINEFPRVSNEVKMVFIFDTKIDVLNFEKIPRDITLLNLTRCEIE